MSELTIQSLMDRLPGAFVPEKAKGIDAKIQFHLTGDKGGDWVVDVSDQECKVDQSSIPNPTLLFTASAQDCLDIFTGKLDGMHAYMTGKLKLTGDMRLAMKLTGLFDPNNF